MRFTRIAAAVGVAAIGLSMAACSSGGGENDNTDSTGPITYVQGKDNSNVVRPFIDEWNKKHPNEKVTFKEQSDNADQQHDDIVQHLQAKGSDYDVISVDNVWTSEFAAKGWLQPLDKGNFKLDTSKFMPATVKSATYNKTLYAGPVTSDGGMLYYRKDLIPEPPKTWDDLWKDCEIAKQNGIDCYAGQYAKYEGLTVNTAEAINTFGGSIVGKDGKTSTVDSPEAKKGLQMLVDHYKSGEIPKAAVTWQEEQGRQAFEAGKLMFLRNWSYVYSLATTDSSSQVKDKFAVAPLPGASADKPGSSSLGGHNAAISAYSKHKKTALEFIKFLESDHVQKDYWTMKASNAPVITELYTDKEIVDKYPFMPTLKTAIENAVPRPISPFYPAVTGTIQTNAYAAIKGEKSVDDAISSISKGISSAGSN